MKKGAGIILGALLIGMTFSPAHGEDRTKPQVTYMSVSPTYFAPGGSTTVKYAVTDSGGSGSKQVELWRRKKGEAWQETQRKLISGNGPITGSFTDSPRSKTTYEYGLHVVDRAGNWDAEGAVLPYPILVTVGSMPTSFDYCGKTRDIPGYCAPQCAAYARKLSGNCDCFNGTADGWFNCEVGKGHTTLTPSPGYVLIKPYGNTGHAMYLKNSQYAGNDKYYLTLAHSNYDNKCSIEAGVKATYYRNTQQLQITSGNWNGSSFKIRGFIKNY